MTTIRPFSIDIPQADLDDLASRLRATRWPDPEPVDDWTQGIPLAYVQELAGYWADGYDWRAREAALNRFDQFVTEIDGVDIHFIHQRSEHEDAFPLLITHGWPGSVVEFHKVIEPLVAPESVGGRPEDAFHVVCPSLPGYGFSGKPTEPGWGVERIAAAWDELMGRLGYDRYGAQGGDWGAAVTTQVGRNGGRGDGGCIAIHTNMPLGRPTEEAKTNPTDEDKAAFAGAGFYREWDSGYSKQQSTRPQTLGYGLADSPSGQLAWIVEKFWAWTDNDGHPEDALSRDELLEQRDAVLGDGVGGQLGPTVLGELRQHGRQRSGRGTDRRRLVPQGDRSLPSELVRGRLQHHPLDVDGQGRPLRRVRAAGGVRRRRSDVLRHRPLRCAGSS